MVDSLIEEHDKGFERMCVGRQFTEKATFYVHVKECIAVCKIWVDRRNAF